MKTLVQCDFDATLTIGEVSHSMLEAFAEGDWKSVQADYYGGKIAVEDCNIRQFAMIKQGPDTIRDFLLNSGKVVMRPGLPELIEHGKKQNWDFSIISNGLRFYIEVILENLGIRGIEVAAAETDFSQEGLKLTYRGPDGRAMQSGFKAAQAEAQRQRGYDRLYYIGDGTADLPPARHADHIFATSVLLQHCREEGLPHTAFNDMFDIINYFKENA